MNQSKTAFRMPINRRIFLSALAATAGSSVLSSARARSSKVVSNDTSDGMCTIRAGVLDVAYRQSGPRDGQAVLLLHGFPYDVHSFDIVASRLAATGKRVIVPYLRGYGPTRFIDGATPRVGQQAALGNDVIALMDALDIRQAILAGFDWGGRAACVVAALHPERVTGLVSSGGPGYNIQNQNTFLIPRSAQWEREHWFYWYLNSRRGMAAFSADPVAFCRYLWRSFSPPWNFTDAMFLQTARSFANPDFVAVALHSYRYRIGEAPGDPMLDAVEKQLSDSPRISVPTIIIEGAEDGVDPPSDIESALQHFGALRRRTVLTGVGHNVPQEAPSQFAAAVLDLCD
ncbi:alpha/beta fold hydrolase [Burkholderia gladioli]|uniref:alpha/beta fold hydrolase n=2 Tax=Burkholderia gladioli TaxID=28095 RepID=UPI001FC801E5|nr:alpha/beta hydrolase [Burkholderia gladioli]